jgi:hypothetical protein
MSTVALPAPAACRNGSARRKKELPRARATVRKRCYRCREPPARRCKRLSSGPPTAGAAVRKRCYRFSQGPRTRRPRPTADSKRRFSALRPPQGMGTPAPSSCLRSFPEAPVPSLPDCTSLSPARTARLPQRQSRQRGSPKRAKKVLQTLFCFRRDRGAAAVDASRRRQTGLSAPAAAAAPGCPRRVSSARRPPPIPPPRLPSTNGSQPWLRPRDRPDPAVPDRRRPLPAPLPPQTALIGAPPPPPPSQTAQTARLPPRHGRGPARPGRPGAVGPALHLPNAGGSRIRVGGQVVREGHGRQGLLD